LCGLPLTPTLSPQERGEGERAVEGGLTVASRHANRTTVL
jgi:hypothetical protein